jgi:hypothetical protein
MFRRCHIAIAIVVRLPSTYFMIGKKKKKKDGGTCVDHYDLNRPDGRLWARCSSLPTIIKVPAEIRSFGSSLVHSGLWPRPSIEPPHQPAEDPDAFFPCARLAFPMKKEISGAADLAFRWEHRIRIVLASNRMAAWRAAELYINLA